jgi:hypothetical protein
MKLVISNTNNLELLEQMFLVYLLLEMLLTKHIDKQLLLQEQDVWPH